MSLPEVPPADDVTTPWWDATREHRLTIQTCTQCDQVQHPPRAVCTGCSSMEHLVLVEASGNGVVDASTVVHRAPRPGVDVPYTVARVRLAEGPIMLTQLTGSNDWTIGDVVTLDWIDLPDGRALPVFTRT